MSAPADGNYFIYNSVPSSAGDKLAVTWKGNTKDPLTVEKLVPDHTQVWILENIGLKNSQAIIPLNDMDLQASWGDGVVDVSDTHGAVWIISEADNGYTIEDGGHTAEWGVTDGKVTLGALNGAPPTQRWTFEKATQ